MSAGDASAANTETTAASSNSTPGESAKPSAAESNGTANASPAKDAAVADSTANGDEDSAMEVEGIEIMDAETPDELASAKAAAQTEQPNVDGQTLASSSSAADGAPAAQEVLTEQKKWVQCERCQKWRQVAREIDDSKLPDIWYCEMNTWDPRFNNCDAPQQEEEEEEVVWPGLPDSFVSSEQREAFYVDLVSTLYAIEQEKARIEADEYLRRKKKKRGEAEIELIVNSRPIRVPDFPQHNGQPVDLFVLYSTIAPIGGFDKATELNKWPSIEQFLKQADPNAMSDVADDGKSSSASSSDIVKQFYRAFLLEYESRAAERQRHGESVPIALSPLPPPRPPQHPPPQLAGAGAGSSSAASSSSSQSPSPSNFGGHRLNSFSISGGGLASKPSLPASSSSSSSSASASVGASGASLLGGASSINLDAIRQAAAKAAAHNPSMPSRPPQQSPPPSSSAAGAGSSSSPTPGASSSSRKRDSSSQDSANGVHPPEKKARTDSRGSSSSSSSSSAAPLDAQALQAVFQPLVERWEQRMSDFEQSLAMRMIAFENVVNRRIDGIRSHLTHVSAEISKKHSEQIDAMADLTRDQISRTEVIAKALNFLVQEAKTHPGLFPAAAAGAAGAGSGPLAAGAGSSSSPNGSAAPVAGAAPILPPASTAAGHAQPVFIMGAHPHALTAHAQLQLQQQFWAAQQQLQQQAQPAATSQLPDAERR